MSPDSFEMQRLSWYELTDELNRAGSNHERYDAAWLEVFGRLRAMALRLVKQRDNSDEVASSIVARMLQHRDDPRGVLARIRQANRPEAYVKTIVRNEIYRLREQESRLRHEQLPLALETSQEDAVDEAIFGELREALLERYIHLMDVGLSSGELTRADFELLQERAHGKPMRQMAVDRGVTESALRKRIERAKQRYRRVFAGNRSQVFSTKEFAECLADALERAAEKIEPP